MSVCLSQYIYIWFLSPKRQIRVAKRFLLYDAALFTFSLEANKACAAESNELTLIIRYDVPLALPHTILIQYIIWF